LDYVLRGNEFVQQQAYDLALEAYNKAIEFQPVPEAFCNRGYVFHEKSEYDRALEDANRAIALKPDFAQAFCNRGAAYFEKGDVGRAIQDYGKAINLEPNLALAFNNRGHAFLLAGRSDLAIVDCNRAVELKPDLALLLEIAARRHFASGALSKRQGTSRMQSGSIRRIAATFVGFTLPTHVPDGPIPSDFIRMPPI
jgi:tetratricopeptide (TPR) repeat protein